MTTYLAVPLLEGPGYLNSAPPRLTVCTAPLAYRNPPNAKATAQFSIFMEKCTEYEARKLIHCNTKIQSRAVRDLIMFI